VTRIAALLGLVALVVVAPLAAVPAFRFPAPTPFSGSGWLNPYASWSGRALKVNLHAHSRAWGGLTAGADEPAALAQAYAARGYDALAISNYHAVTELSPSPLPLLRAYEHGINVTKSHRLVLGAAAPLRFDFPVSTRSIRQFMLTTLGRSAALIGLNHPSLQGGHGCDDVSALTGFQLMEVHNPYATSHFEWDCALTAGRLAWVVGNDDAHVVRDSSIGVSWNRIEAEPSEASIINALRAGRSYAVRGEGGVEDLQVISLELDAAGDVELRLTAEADVEWVADGGAVRQRDQGISSSRYRPTAADHYVRAVVRTARTEMLLNPIVRQGRWVEPRASIDWPMTVGGWLAWLAGAFVLARALRPARGLYLVRDRPRQKAA
jgi:hypothetical protein